MFHKHICKEWKLIFLKICKLDFYNLYKTNIILNFFYFSVDQKFFLFKEN